MLNCVKASFGLTNRYIILATPLIIFSLLSSLYLLFSTAGSLISLGIAVVLFLLMLAAFLSGWFYMLKLAVLEEEKEDTNLLIKEFPSGVGEYFLSVLGVQLNVFILSGILLTIAYFLGMKFIGNLGISAEAMSGAFETIDTMKKFLMSLTEDQLLRLNLWNFLLFGAMGLEYFILMFYMPVVVFKEKNPFKAFFISLRDLFSRKFFHNVLLYVLIFVSYSILSVLTTLAGFNVVTHFVFTLVNFYYMVYVALLICKYYYENFVRIGGNLDKSI